MTSPGAAAEVLPGPAGPAIAFAGADAIRYALARIPAGQAVVIDAGESVRQVLGNPFYAVSFAHADASATLRRAAALGLRPGEPAGFEPGRLAGPAERTLLGVISWLPERVAGPAAAAGRMGSPGIWSSWPGPISTSRKTARRCRPAGAPRRVMPPRPARGYGWRTPRGRRCGPDSACSACPRPPGDL